MVDLRQIDARGIGQVEEERVVLALGVAERRLRVHVDRLVPRVGSILGRADVHAQVAAGAVLRRHLNRVGLRLEFVPLVGHGLERPRRAGERGVVIHLGADGCVRADQHALIALDADRLVPHRDLEREVPLLPLRRADRPGAVHWKRAHRQQIALAGHEDGGHPLDEVGRQRRHHRRTAVRRGDARRHRHLVEVGERRVHGLEVAPDDFRAALAVGLLDRVLDLRDRLFARQDAGDREEAGLHDRVDAAAHAGVAGHGGRVDGVEADALLDHLLLHLARQMVPDLAGLVGRVQQENRPLRRVLEHVEAFQELELVAGDEPGLRDEIGRSDPARARAQVRHGHRAGLLGVVDEVALHVQRRFLRR